MDSILLDNNQLYLAENCVRAFATPTFIPSIVYSTIAGILAVIFYEKYTRKEYFLPYLYFGNTALLYAVSHIFLIIFVQEENNIKFARDSGDEDIILTHENALYGSLIISACGSFFINLALFRLLEVWIRVGQKKKTFSHLPRGFVTLSVVILSLIPVAFSVAGDALLIIESSKEEEMSVQVRKALVLKIIGAACNVVLVIFYLALCVIYSWSAYICNTVEKAIKYRHTAPVGEKGKEASPEVDHPLRKPKRTFRKVVIMLMALGVLVLIRFLYNLYIVLMVLLSGPIWDIYAYLILVVADGLIFLVTAYCSSLSNVKAPIIYANMNSNVYHNKSSINKVSPSHLHTKEEVIPLSRSPVVLDEDTEDRH